MPPRSPVASHWCALAIPGFLLIVPHLNATVRVPQAAPAATRARVGVGAPTPPDRQQSGPDDCVCNSCVIVHGESEKIPERLAAGVVQKTLLSP